MAYALSVIGRVGKPGDSLAQLGAARFYLGDDEWQQKVDALLRGSGAIVLRPDGCQKLENLLVSTLVWSCIGKMPIKKIG